MIKRYLLAIHAGAAAEFREIGEPFCDKILFRRDGVTTLDGKDVRWSKLYEIGGEIPAEAIPIETDVENYGRDGFAF